MVEKLRVFKLAQAVNLQQFGLKRADTCGNDDDFGAEVLAFGGHDLKAAIRLCVYLADNLTQVKRRIEGFDLFEQAGG